MEYRFSNRERIKELRFIFDSHLNRPIHNMPCYYPLDQDDFHVPSTMLKRFRIDALDSQGDWKTVARVENNYQRLVRLKIDIYTQAVRFVPEATWGAEKVHMFAWDIR